MRNLTPTSSPFHALTPLAVVVAAFLTALLVLSVAAPAAAAAPPVERFHGDDRVGTAIELSRAVSDDADHALLTHVDVYPDALGAGSMAASLDAPLLLTERDELLDDVSAELDRLDVGTVYILGGPTVVGYDVHADLQRESYVVRRLSGDNRFETASAAAQHLFEGPQEQALLALGEKGDREIGWPDAAAAASLAGVSEPAPTLLTRRAEVPAATLDALDALEVDTVRVLGGQRVISSEVVTQLEDDGYNVERTFGTSRYVTAAQVAGEALARNGEEPMPAVFAAGTSAVDSVTGGSAAARLGGSLLLLRQDALSGAPKDFLREHSGRWDRGLVVGGTSGLDAFMLDSVSAVLAGDPAPERPEPEPDPEPEPEPEQTVATDDPNRRVSDSTWDALAQCESNGNWQINTGNGYYGGLQFNKSSWDWAGGNQYAAYPHQASREQQILTAERLLQIHPAGWGAWPACSSKLGLG